MSALPLGQLPLEPEPSLALQTEIDTIECGRFGSSSARAGDAAKFKMTNTSHGANNLFIANPPMLLRHCVDAVVNVLGIAIQRRAVTIVIPPVYWSVSRDV